MPYDALFQSAAVGGIETPNRIFMAPLTRCRATPEHVPTPVMATYYAQRAAAGLIIAECTMVRPGMCSYYRMPGVFNDAQVEGWKAVTDAVHTAGGRILLQIWHGGRTSHALLNDGVEPVAPSAIRIESDGVHTPQGKVPFAMPRELTVAEIAGIVADFGAAARNAKRAGFDGIEIHGANGYLIDQFLRDGTNRRTDAYGGSLENRLRFLTEVLDAVIAEVGADRVGVRISPLNSYHEMLDSDPAALTAAVAKLLDSRKAAYLHVMRGDFFGVQTGDVLAAARNNYGGTLIANMGYTPEEADAAIREGKIDAVTFGHHFISNPDLVERVRRSIEFVEPDANTFYAGEERGYTDYPALAA
jgi:N-ethylmaleimide reductase